MVSCVLPGAGLQTTPWTVLLDLDSVNPGLSLFQYCLHLQQVHASIPWPGAVLVKLPDNYRVKGCAHKCGPNTNRGEITQQKWQKASFMHENAE